MTHPTDPLQEPDSRPWFRILFAMTLPVLWLVAGILFLPAAS